MNKTPIFDEMQIAYGATAPMPTRTVPTNAFCIWCVVCEGEDFMHEHPEDERAPHFGDEAVVGTFEEWAYIKYQRSLPIKEQHYYQRAEDVRLGEKEIVAELRRARR